LPSPQGGGEEKHRCATTFAPLIEILFNLLKLQRGRVAEWFKAPVLKTGRGSRSLVGSNPTPSARIKVFSMCYSH
jgi:hypothetical protein